jgi:aminobenzoyl-glutamate transport protein
MVEPRLGTFHANPGPLEGGADVREAPSSARTAAEETLDPVVQVVPSPAPLLVEEAPDPTVEGRGLRYALYAFLAAASVIALLTVIPGAPLRNAETGDIVGDSPFMDSLVFLISVLFLAAGLGYGLGARTYTSSVEVIKAIENAFAGLASLVFLLVLISQFKAFFNFSNMPTIAAASLADLLEQFDVGAVPLLVGLLLVICLLDIIMPGALQWAIFAPIFVPLFMELGVSPQTVLAAYRIGDSPMNVITPLMVYLPFIVLVAQRYESDSGLGTIISLMIPYTFVILITWVVFFIVWYLIGLPLGPGYPVKL